MLATVDNAFLRFAELVGIDRYIRLSLHSDERLFGELVFRAAAFPSHFEQESTAALLQELFEMSGRHRVSRCPKVDSFRSASDLAADDAGIALKKTESFVKEAANSVLQRDPRIVGLSASSHQTLASIAIARRIKEIRPEVVTVLGGACATGERTARALREAAGVFDFVFSGEADMAFPEFCDQYLNEGTLPSQPVVSCPAVGDLNVATIPDYSDYFDQIEPLKALADFTEELPTALFFEFARGCWWAERRNCLFCGLNGPEVCYRPKSIPRVIQELRILRDRYRVNRMFAADTILPPHVGRQVLPAAIQADLGLELSFEVIPTANRGDLDAFFRAGVRDLFAGIESLSTSVLRKLRKRNTALQNLVFLRDCVSRRIRAHWNFLVAVPGESRSDYEAVARLIPLLEHLPPPVEWGPLRIDRFSPLYSEASELELRNLRPFPVYFHLFPESVCIENLAQGFVADYDTAFLCASDLQEEIGGILQRWREIWDVSSEVPKLCGTELVNGLLLVEDTRTCAVDRYYVASPDQSRMLQRLVRPVKGTRIEDDVQPVLEELLRRNLVALHEGHLLSLVTTPSPTPPSRPLPIS